MTDREFEQLTQEAAKLGREAGENAAAWWEQDAIGGRATSGERDRAELTLKGIEDGDPAVMDSLPFPNLSGQWADDPTPQTLMAELDCEVEPEEEPEICEAWEVAASDAVLDSVERMCRELLS